MSPSYRFAGVMNVALVLLATAHPAIADTWHEENHYRFKDPRDFVAFKEDQDALKAPLIPHGYKWNRTKDPQALVRAQATLEKKQVAVQELYVNGMAALTNGDRALFVKLFMRAKDILKKQGPEGSEFFTTIYGLLIHSAKDTALQLETAREFASFADRISAREMLNEMEVAYRIARETGDESAQRFFTEQQDRALKKMYAQVEAHSEKGTGGVCYSLTEHGFQALARGDAAEAAKAFSAAQKDDDADRARYMKWYPDERFGVLNSSPIKAQISRGLALAYCDLGEFSRAREVRANLASYVLNEQYPTLLKKLDIDSTIGSSASHMSSELVSTVQPFLLPANYPEDGFLPDTLLRWKSIAAVFRRAANQRRAELSSADREELRQKEADDVIRGSRNGADHSFQRAMSDISEKRSAYLSEEGSKTLARAISDVSDARLNMGAIRASLGEEDAVVDFLRFPSYEGHGLWQLCYGALITTKSHDPQWIVLGPALALDEIIVRHDAQLSNDRVTDASYFDTLKALSSAVWLPLAQHVPKGLKRLWICPDGGLGSISFASLLSPDEHFIGESVQIAYCVNVRDLLEARSVPKGKRIELFGFPDYGSAKQSEFSPPSSAAIDSVRSASRLANSFFLIAGVARTKEECEGIADKARAAGYEVSLRLGANAAERALALVTSPRILHIATHGFYYSFSAADAPSSRLSDNPHNASGIALTGANTTLAQWSNGQVPPATNDGIVTALEASYLDLHETTLTVLSACKSAVGHQISGIGVIGLRSALYQAGTRNLLVALWCVDDESTLQFMSRFYDNLFRMNDVENAFYETQHRMLAEFRAKTGEKNPHNIRRAVESFGPFLLNTTASLVR